MSHQVNQQQMPLEYNMKIVKFFTIATCFWGVVGMLVGVLIAAQMTFPWLNIEPYLTFGRLRPLHTSGVIFAFGGDLPRMMVPV